jgi:hypothetical protein
MSKRRSGLTRTFHRISVAAASLARSAGANVSSLLRSRRGIAVEVVIADAPRRRAIASEVRRAHDQLRRALGSDLPADLVVVVQQTVMTDHPLAGCFQTHRRADGSRALIVRLALQVEGRRLSLDDVLAALADACVGIVAQSSGSSVLVPVGPAAARPAATALTSAIGPDPLAPRQNGTIAHAHVP